LSSLLKLSTAVHAAARREHHTLKGGEHRSDTLFTHFYDDYL